MFKCNTWLENATLTVSDVLETEARINNKIYLLSWYDTYSVVSSTFINYYFKRSETETQPLKTFDHLNVSLRHNWTESDQNHDSS